MSIKLNRDLVKQAQEAIGGQPKEASAGKLLGALGAAGLGAGAATGISRQKQLDEQAKKPSRLEQLQARVGEQGASGEQGAAGEQGYTGGQGSAGGDDTWTADERRSFARSGIDPNRLKFMQTLGGLMQGMRFQDEMMGRALRGETAQSSVLSEPSYDQYA